MIGLEFLFYCEFEEFVGDQGCETTQCEHRAAPAYERTHLDQPRTDKRSRPAHDLNQRNDKPVTTVTTGHQVMGNIIFRPHDCPS